MQNWFYKKANQTAEVDTSSFPIHVLEIAIDTLEKLTHKRGNIVPIVSRILLGSISVRALEFSMFVCLQPG